MASPRRIEQVENLLREVIAEIVARDVPFAEGTLVTITRVETSDDLYYGRVFVSILAPSQDAESTAFAELMKSTSAIQHALNRKLRMRPVPRITFAIDEQEKRRERIEKLLADGERETR